MTTLVVLFNLRSGASRNEYETWARETDLPIVRSLSSVREFQAYRTSGLFGSVAAAPYEYVEVLRLESLDALAADLASPTMQRVAAEFQQFADSPAFIVAEPL